MNKWLEILLGLILVVASVAEWGFNYTGLNFGAAAIEVLKGGVIWGIIFIGLLLLMLGISDLRE